MNQQKIKIFIRPFLKSLVASVLFFLIVYYFLDSLNSKSNDLIKNNEVISIARKESQFDFNLNEIYSDLILLSTISSLEKYSNFNQNDSLLDCVQNDFLSLAKNRDFYDQVRLIDIHGNEKVRVNKSEDSVYLVTSSDLQNKKDRYYFENTIDLYKNLVYLSPIDLNVENSVIQNPIKPVLRISTPIFNSKEERKGIIVLNYLAENLLSNAFSSASFIVLNNDSYYLSSDDKSKNWGFMYDDKRKLNKFENDHPEAWEKISNSSKGQFLNSKGLYTYTKYTPGLYLHEGGDLDLANFKTKRSWFILSFIGKDELYSNFNANVNYLYSVTVLLFVLLFYFYSRINKLNLAKQGNIKALIKSELEYKDKSDELAKVNESYVLLNERLNLQNIELDKVVNLKDKLFSIISHDLKNPFNAIIGFSDLLKSNDEITPKQVKQFATAINTSSKSAFELLSNLLDWSRVQTSSISIEKKSSSIKEVIDDSILLVDSQLGLKKIKIEFSNFEDTMVFIDIVMMKTVVRNVISNAIKFSNEKDCILISSIVSENSIEVCFSDSGVGIPAKSLSQIFNSGINKSSYGTKGESGTGLGLLLCKDFIEKNDGSIRIESEVGKGTKVYLTIPRG